MDGVLSAERHRRRRGGRRSGPETARRPRRATRLERTAVRDAVRRLTVEASRHQVPADPAGLDDLTARSASWNEAQRRGLAAGVIDTPPAGVEREQREARRRNRCGRRRTETVDRHERALADPRITAIEEALGSQYDDVLERIGALERQLGLDESERDRIRKDLPGLERRIGKLEQQVEQAESRTRCRHPPRIDTSAHRDRPAPRHRHRCRHRTPQALDGVTAVLAAARDITTKLGISDTSAPPRTSRLPGRRATPRRSATSRRIRHRANPQRRRLDRSDALVGGQRRRIGDLAGALRTNLDSATAELHDEEDGCSLACWPVTSAARSPQDPARQRTRRQHQPTRPGAHQGGRRPARLTWNVDDAQWRVRSARALLLRDPSDLTDTETTALKPRTRSPSKHADLEANAAWKHGCAKPSTTDAGTASPCNSPTDWGLQTATAKRLQALDRRTIHRPTLPMLASIAAHYTAADGRPATRRG